MAFKVNTEIVINNSSNVSWNIVTNSPIIEDVRIFGSGTKRVVPMTAEEYRTWTNATTPLTNPSGIDPVAIRFGLNGTRLYVLTNSGRYVHEMSMSEDWNINTVVRIANTVSEFEDTFPQDIAFSQNGSKMYYLGSTNDRIYEFDLLTPWSVNTASYTSNVSVASQDTTPTSLDFNSDGTKLYVAGNQNDRIYQYNLSVPWSVNSASYVANTSIASTQTQIGTVRLSRDGDILCISGTNPYRINMYTLSTPFDITTATSVPSANVNINRLNVEDGQAFTFGKGGEKIVILKNQYSWHWGLYRYSLTTPYDLSTFHSKRLTFLKV